MKRLLFTLWQALWGLPQSLLGLILFLYHRSRSGCHSVFHGALVVPWRTGGSMSLGLFIFMGTDRQDVLVHEFGHSVQSMILGPLFLPLVGLPSFLWANLPAFRRLRAKKRLSYYAVYPENWANALGEWATKELSPDKRI